ncbi:type II secretion system protein N [Dokdonella fugitiva]|jgi:general secretion pathway protein C|uniref:General secretion pathway protein C n=1 Tax=Dokdonella fugitiva TaxID=328517 RepID=A0A4R2IAB1_9GAMM|nr:type II secretion system protein N [Dokdonella fugitiva]TCO41403.1 general secretion pathway protein C [Dokdonella fugitiva]
MPVAFPAHDRGRVALLAANLCCALLAVLALWLLVRLLWALVPGDDAAIAPAPVPAGVASAAAPARSIAQWHLFGSAPAQRGGDGPSTTSLILRGTLADADPKAGIAVIADAGNGERSWRVGEEVSPGVRLARVYADRVVVTRDGTEETLALPRDGDLRPASVPRGAPGTASSHAARANTTTSTNTPAPRARAPTSLQAQIERLRQNPAELMKRVQVVPVLSDGHLSGVRVSTGTDTVLLSQLGFEQGDVVTAVNGTPVDSIERGQQIMSSLGSASSVRVTVLRAGKPTEITVGLR